MLGLGLYIAVVGVVRRKRRGKGKKSSFGNLTGLHQPDADVQ